MNQELLNYALSLKVAIQSMMHPGYLYQTGNMKSSVEVVIVDDENVDVVVATSYASYTNERGHAKGWVQRVVDNHARCYSENVSNNLIDKQDEINEGDGTNG